MFHRLKKSKTERNSDTGKVAAMNDGDGVQTNSIHYHSRFHNKKSGILRLIEGGNWNALMKLLRSKWGIEVSNIKDSTNLNMLGLALGRRAPLDVISLILEINPGLILERDDFGAVPLHLGCLNGISVEAMNCVFQHDDGQSARIRDNDNRTALHHAVEFCCKSIVDYDDTSSASIIYEESLEVVEELLQVAPETVLFVSSRGDCPLDIPHEIKAKHNIAEDPKIDEIYYLMKEASIEIYRGRRAKWEESGYDTGALKVEDDVDEVHAPSLVSSLASSSQITPKIGGESSR